MKWLTGLMKPRKSGYLFDGLSLRNGRPTNMDALGVSQREIDGAMVLLAVVCDGVGSLEHGAFAAEEAIRGMMAWFSELESREMLLMRMRERLERINRQILDISEQEQVETAATFSALLLSEQKYYIAHAGDSRIYRLAAGRLEQITVDDVAAAGELTSCIGIESDPKIHYAQGYLYGGDTFLLCSDGMYKRMDMDFLQSQMEVNSQEDITQALSNLVRYVANKGERDNISLAIVKTKNGGTKR